MAVPQPINLARQPYQHLVPPDQISAQVFDGTKAVQIRHPGLPSTRNIIFHFNAYDHPQGGIHHQFAFTACAIVAGNQWDGYLSSTARGEPVGSFEDTPVLTEKDYFYHPHPYQNLDQASRSPLDPTKHSPCVCFTSPYPLLPKFSDWPFPHGKIPKWWSDIAPSRQGVSLHARSAFSTAVQARDISCRVTDTVENCESAHLVPSQETDWFEDQGMGRYSIDRAMLPIVENSANSLRLRKDLHHWFDELGWVIVPKDSQWVFHLLSSSEKQGPILHNASLHPLKGISVEYLLAAFARAIFSLLGRWLRDGADKVLFEASVGVEDPTGKLFDGKWCRFNFPPNQERKGSRSPSKSPEKSPDGSRSKRKRGDDRGDEDNLPVITQDNPEKKIKRPLDSFLDGPCRCPPLPSTPSSTESLDEALPDQGPIECFSRHCTTLEDLRRLGKIRQDALKHERDHSKTTQWWENQTKWMEMMRSRTTGGDEYRRILWAQGIEVRDDDGEYFGPSETFIRGFRKS
ncbi:MAG: hypothetical protein Q9219_006778 [cf. Caloplaca sp. 3 TL-2023]